MALILKLGAKAEEAPKCLACHALNPAPEQRGRAFEISEGVSCENCHGPASAWLGPHATRAWPHEKSVAAGMHDTRDVIHRTEKCLECHLGTRNQFVDRKSTRLNSSHEIISYAVFCLQKKKGGPKADLELLQLCPAPLLGPQLMLTPAAQADE